MDNRPQDAVGFGQWLFQADTLACLAGMFAVAALATFIFAERWAGEGARMTWAPWMRKNTPTSYRRLAYAFAVLAVVSAIGSFASYMT